MELNETATASTTTAETSIASMSFLNLNAKSCEIVNGFTSKFDNCFTKVLNLKKNQFSKKQNDIKK